MLARERDGWTLITLMVMLALSRLSCPGAQVNQQYWPSKLWGAHDHNKIQHQRVTLNSIFDWHWPSLMSSSSSFLIYYHDKSSASAVKSAVSLAKEQKKRDESHEIAIVRDDTFEQLPWWRKFLCFFLLRTLALLDGILLFTFFGIVFSPSQADPKVF